MQLDEEMTDWLVAHLRGEKRRPHERTPASAALWRAYRALSAARYHLQDRPEEEQVRELRRLVEELWHDLSPQFPAEGRRRRAPRAPRGRRPPAPARHRRRRGSRRRRRRRGRRGGGGEG